MLAALLAIALFAQPVPELPPELPAGRAYVLSAPNDPAWLALVTRGGRWAIRCGPEPIPPATNVMVWLAPGLEPVMAEIAPMVLTPDGQPMPDLLHGCLVEQALFATSVPCAELDGVCDIAAESEGEQPDIGPTITIRP